MPLTNRRLPTRLVNYVNRRWENASVDLEKMIHAILDFLNDSWGGVHEASGSSGGFPPGNPNAGEGGGGSGRRNHVAKFTSGSTIGVSTPMTTFNTVAADGSSASLIVNNGTTTHQIARFQNDGVDQVKLGNGVPNDNSQHFLEVIGTMPTTPSTLIAGVLSNITGAGSAAQDNAAIQFNYLAGYTGGNNTFGMIVDNANAGTLDLWNGGNWAAAITAHGVGAGQNTGVYAVGRDSTTHNRGLLAQGVGASTAVAVGIEATASTSGSGAVCAGAFFLNKSGSAFYTTTSAAIVADNGDSTAPIALFKNNGTNQVLIGDGVPNDNSQHFLEVVGTLPASPSVGVDGILFNITSAGSAAQFQQGVTVNLNSGFTGAQVSRTLSVSNSAAGTIGNFGVQATTTGTVTGGLNVGVSGNAGNADTNVGTRGISNFDKNNAKNIGVFGGAVNAGTTPTKIGGVFALHDVITSLTLTSSALVADNSTEALPIILAQDNGTVVWSVQDNGHMYSKMATKTLTEATATAFVRIAVAQSTSVSGQVKYQIQANDATDFQSRSGVLQFTAVNKAGTETVTLGTPDASSEVFAESAGASTLTNTFDTVTGTDTFDIRANATSSLAQTTLRINYTLELWSHSVTTVTPQ